MQTSTQTHIKGQTTRNISITINLIRSNKGKQTRYKILETIIQTHIKEQTSRDLSIKIKVGNLSEKRQTKNKSKQAEQDKKANKVRK